jgi:hypothetical protein
MFLATDDIKASLQQSARTFVEDIVNIIISGLQKPQIHRWVHQEKHCIMTFNSIQSFHLI